MSYLKKIVLGVCLSLGFFACNEIENYTGGPSVIDVVESVTINEKEAGIDHLAGLISVSLPGNTDLSSVDFAATAPDGVTITPGNGTIDLTSPVEVIADNGSSQRVYRIRATLLPSKVAFLGDGPTLEEVSDDDERAAARWAQETYGEDFAYISYAELSDETLNGVNVIFYVHDQVGSADQPQALLDKLNVLSKFFVNGGKIVAGQHGTGIVAELGRDNSGLRTILGTGEGGVNMDVWAIGFTNSPAANIISDGVERNPDGSIPVINGGFKEDHNSMWTLDPIDEPKYANFETQYGAEVLATWDWNVASQGTGGIILWKPQGRFQGTIMTLGVGGMEWNMNDGRENEYADNIRTIYKNAIDYLRGL